MTVYWLHSMDGNLSNKLAYDFLNPNQPVLDWFKFIWNAFVLPTRAFIFLRLAHHKLPTNNQLRKRGCILVSVCCFCYRAAEHIMFHCSVASQLWNWFSNSISQPLDLSSWDNLLHCSQQVWSPQVKQFMLSAKLHTIWII